MAVKEGPEHREARGDAFLYDSVLIFSSKRVDGSFNWEPLPWRGAPRLVFLSASDIPQLGTLL